MSASYKPIGATLVRSATRTLTAAQIKAPHGTAEYTLIAAPGSNRQIVLIASLVLYNPGETGYDTDDGGAHLTVLYGTTGGTSAPVVLPEVTGTTALESLRTDFGINSPQAPLVNQPIIITNDSSSNFTLGDGTLTVILLYFVLDLITGAIVPG